MSLELTRLMRSVLGTVLVLCSYEAPPGPHCSQIWSSQPREDRDLPKRAQRGHEDDQRVMEKLCYGDGLGELEVSNLEKKRLWGTLRNPPSA